MADSYGIISDIHGNLVALEIALEFLDQQGIDHIICCGDVVGYGPWPNECLQLVKDKTICCILGNHDAAAINMIEAGHFNGNAGTAIRWTKERLTEDSVDYLAARPQKSVEAHFFVTHASPREPLREYLTDRWTAYANFHHFQQRIGWFGHSHAPTVFVENKGDTQGGFITDTQTITIIPGERYLINPGSVGQPRDGDWRLSLAIYQEDDDGERVSFYRLEYDVARVQEEMKQANLPPPLYNRLTQGR